MHFFAPKIFWTSKFLAHMKIESTISDLGTKINFLNREMTEQMSFEVDVKNDQKSEKVQVHFFCSKCTLQLNFFGPREI